MSHEHKFFWNGGNKYCIQCFLTPEEVEVRYFTIGSKVWFTDTEGLLGILRGRVGTMLDMVIQDNSTLMIVHFEKLGTLALPAMDMRIHKES